MIRVAFLLVPFFLEAIIRIGVFHTIGLSVFRSSTLAMSIGILCILVNQGFVRREQIIKSPEEKEEIVWVAHVFFGLAIFCFVFFGVVVLLQALIEKGNISGIEPIKYTFDTIILVGAFIPVRLSFWAQKSFNLRAVL
uniref:Uncharacterized protein n=1 Tax=Candidatus Kentrum sp. FW TaxID=2126338 RepID=A0A450T1H8_9GAMM|nr:MAG: hypothetical protein BECKFW1821A_GA0114235_110115 [Candidatus Kentron sp. FW]